MSFTGRVSALDAPVGCLADIIGIISPFETPLLNHLGDPTTEAESLIHTWQDKTWARSNIVQMFSATLTAQAAGKYNMVDELDYQTQERVRELLRDLENTVINGVFAGTEDGRKMRGIVSMLTSPRYDAGGHALDEPFFTDTLKQLHDNGMTMPDTIVVNGFQKRRFNTMQEPQSPTTSLYESDYGVFNVILSRWVPADSILLLDRNRVLVKPLTGRSFRYERREHTDEVCTGRVFGEYTLELRDETAHAVVHGLAVM